MKRIEKAKIYRFLAFTILLFSDCHSLGYRNQDTLKIISGLTITHSDFEAAREKVDQLLTFSTSRKRLQRLGLGNQWQWQWGGGISPWGLPKPKNQLFQNQISSQTQASVSVLGSASNKDVSNNYLKCETKKFEGIYYFGTLSTVARNVDSVSICVAVCWQLRERGWRCGSVNYLKKQLRCEIVDDELKVQKTYMMRYLTESNTNAIYVIPILCERASYPMAQQFSVPASEHRELPPAGSCGQTFVEPRIYDGHSKKRIIGGVEARAHSYPWLVELQDMGDHLCGGTIVRAHPTIDESDIIVTAAHCFQERPQKLRILLGAHSLRRRPAPDQKKLTAARYIVHQKYNQTTTVNDIAVIQLNQTVKFGITIQPACLPEYGENVRENQSAIVAGWGSTQEFLNRVPDVLMQVQVKTLNYDLCATKFYPGEMFTPQMFCAGHIEGGRDSCQGDSGGPLVFKTSNGWIMRGVVSFGEGCARAEKPGVYTNVSYYVPWLQETIALLTAVRP